MTGTGISEGKAAGAIATIGQIMQDFGINGAGFRRN